MLERQKETKQVFTSQGLFGIRHYMKKDSCAQAGWRNSGLDNIKQVLFGFV